MPMVLLAYMVETGLLTKLEIAEAIIVFEKQTEVWLPDSRDQACSVIGKFTQGAKAYIKRLIRRLITDQGELDFLVRDTCQSGTLVGAPAKCLAGWILTYYDSSQPQYAHLRASMLAYAHINLLKTYSSTQPRTTRHTSTGVPPTTSQRALHLPTLTHSHAMCSVTSTVVVVAAKPPGPSTSSGLETLSSSRRRTGLSRR